MEGTLQMRWLKGVSVRECFFYLKKLIKLYGDDGEVGPGVQDEETFTELFL